MRRAIATAVWKIAGLGAIALAAGCGGASASGGSGGSDAGGGGAASGQTGGTGSSGSASSGASAGGSSGGNANPGSPPQCDAATDNITVSGFGTTVAMAGGTPITSITGVGDTAGGLAYQTGTSSGGIVTANIVSASQAIRQGVDLEIGKDATLTVQGMTGGQPFLCDAASGNIKVNSLAAHAIDPNSPLKGELLDKANVSFTATCKQATAKPAGVTQVTGCYNYIAQ